MKAAQFNKYGGPEVIEINSDAKKPDLNPGQILVEVYAAGLNPVESSIRNGYLKEMLPLEFPVNAGGDFAGVVSGVTEGVTEFKAGDKVYGSANHLKGGSGSLAEFVVAEAANTELKPEKVDFSEAASLPLVGASVIQALEETMKLKSGQKILIHGGAGGIGSLAIQLAKHLDAYVATTVSSKDIEFVKGLGADEVINYENQKFEEILKDFDAVYNTVGGEIGTKSFEVLKSGGVIVGMKGAPDPELAKKHQVTAVGQMSAVSSAQLSRLAQLVDEGVIKPQVAKTFTLDEARQAFEYFETQHPEGKVVVKIK